MESDGDKVGDGKWCWLGEEKIEEYQCS